MRDGSCRNQYDAGCGRAGPGHDGLGDSCSRSLPDFPTCYHAVYSSSSDALIPRNSRGISPGLASLFELAPAPFIGGIMHSFYKNCRAAAMVAATFVFSIGMANAGIASAQSGGSSGTINGTVVDPSGAVVANAKVEIHDPVTGFDRTTTTDNKGSFSFLNVPFNPYHMTVAASGFDKYAQDVSLRSVVPVSVQINLMVSGSSTEVTVEDKGRPGGERSDVPLRRRQGFDRQAPDGDRVVGTQSNRWRSDAWDCF